MQLTLKYQPGTHAQPSAVLLRGNEPRWWLEHIRAWKLRPADMTLLALADASGDQIAGLFVVFHDNKTPDPALLPEPFVRVGKKMFIPQDAVLQPALTDAELNALCIWDYQLLHPSLGFYGLEAADVLPPESLVILPVPVEAEWDFHQTGYAALPRLSRIRMEAPAEETYLREAKSIGNKELSEIPAPEGKPKGFFGKFWHRVQLNYLTGIKALLTAPGRQSRFSQWLDKQINRLKKQQEDDAHRLLRLFRENPSLALEFAPPLDPSARPGNAPEAGGGWFTRSVAEYSSSLLKMGGSGGRGARLVNDATWRDLQAEYRRAAAHAEKDGEWSRAAYIYAHLLKDYHAAATALRNGKFFRDAAHIYHHQLENIHKAAECYQEAGMYPEAIELYLQMELFGQAGDLYMLHGDTAAAAGCFEKGIDYDLKNENYFGAAQTIHDKLHDRERARLCLLNGWYSNASADRCLVQFIHLSDAPLPETLRRVFDEHVEPGNYRLFLSVLNTFKNDPEAADTVRDLAFRIVGEAVQKGDRDLLPMLANLVPGDPFLRTDVNLYIKQFPAEKTAVRRNISSIQLRKDVTWLYAYNWRQQIIVLGRENGLLKIARCNWEGMVTYHNLPMAFPAGAEHLFFVSDDSNTFVIIDQSTNTGSHTLAAQIDFGDALHVSLNPDSVAERGLHCIGRWNGHLHGMEKVADEWVIMGYHADSPASVDFFVADPLPPCTNLRELIHWGEVYVDITGSSFSAIDGKGNVRFTKEGAFDMYRQSGQWLAGAGYNGEVWYYDLAGTYDNIYIIDHMEFAQAVYFVTADTFVVANSTQYNVYRIRDNEAILVRSIRHADQEKIPYAVIASGTDGRFGILTENGEITFHDIPEEISA